MEKLLAALQYLLPQHLLTALVHRCMRCRWRWLKNLQIRGIARLAGIDWSEAISPDPDTYPTFNHFFTRELKPGARPLDPDPAALLSPCDGRISECGPLSGETLLQAKGHHFSLVELLASDPACQQLTDGNFWTIYLSPRDYHRVHMPLAGSLQRMTYVPGDLFSVAPYTVRQVPRLFARNERVISVFETAVGPMAQVLVGAMLVAGMDTVWAGPITPARPRELRRTSYAPGEVSLARGQEMGRFNMGSTVVLVLPRGAVTPQPGLLAGAPLRMGGRLGLLHAG